MTNDNDKIEFIYSTLQEVYTAGKGIPWLDLASLKPKLLRAMKYIKEVRND